MVTETKTVKLPEQEFEKVREARRLLAIRGIGRLEPRARETIQEEISGFEKLTMGIIIGIGATLLIQALTEE